MIFISRNRNWLYAFIFLIGLSPNYLFAPPPKISNSTPNFSGSSKTNPSRPSFSGKSSANKPSFSSSKSSPRPITTSGIKPSSSGFDSSSSSEQRKSESRQEMLRSKEPRREYTVANKTIKIDPKDQKIERLRKDLDHQKWVNRQQRQETFYAKYQDRPVVIYHDPYSSFFWWYLLDRSLDQQAMWAYHHRESMDEQRYKDLLAKNDKLAAKVAELEKAKTPKDPNYKLPDVDDDLQYSDEYVDAALNPEDSSGEFGTFVFWVLIIAFSLAVICIIISAFFYRGPFA